jgi:peroxiredoxin
MAKNRVILIVFVAVAALLIFYFYHKYRMAPDIELQKLEVLNEKGEPFDLNSLKGKKLVISFYASWCGNCLQELRDLNKIKASELSDIEIVCITDESLEKLMDFKEKTGYSYLFLKLKKQFPEIGINSIPVTYIVNRELKVVEEHVGYIQWNDASTLNHIKSLY